MRKAQRKYKYARYPLCFGKLDLKGLVNVARKHGMTVIGAYKPNMHVCNEIGLYGTPSAMKATDAEWKANGHDIETLRSRLPFGFDLSLPRDEWLDCK